MTLPVDRSEPGLRQAAAPDPAVLAAITAAVQLAWPRPAPADEHEHESEHQRWRFSGRWWNKPIALGRDRPWARR